MESLSPCCVVCSVNKINQLFGVIFPTNLETKNAWLSSIGRSNWTPKKHSSLCSKHFEEKDFKIRGAKRMLNNSAIPSKFVPIFLKKDFSLSIKEMETNTLNKKNTSYRTFCHVCLSRDRQLFSIEKYANIFQNICEGKFTSQTLLCWECTAVLRRIKQFKERVELSTKILNQFANGPVYPFNSISNLKITENETIIKCEECEKVNNIKEELVVKSSNDDYKPIFNYSIEENEELIDVKEEFNDDDNDIVSNDTDIFENNDPYLEVKSEDAPTTSKECVVKSEETPTTGKKGKHKKKKLKRPYRIILNDDKNIKSLVRKVVLTTEEVKSYMDEQRLSVFFKNRAYRCEQCALSWNSENGFLQHNNKYHAKSAGELQCNICLSLFKTEKDLTLHTQRHLIMLECCTCAYRSYRDVMKGHLKTHHRRYECIECNARFSNICLFRQHHKKLHFMFICDICGKKAKSKTLIEKHIGLHFEKYECKLCNLKYKTKCSLKYHQSLKHSPKTDDAYCVQCDKKFCHAAVYREHLLRSAAHAAEPGAAERVPCPYPECGRRFTRKVDMKNHYIHIHLKQSKYYCELCNKHYLTRGRYKDHVKYTHEGVNREKNKLCNICGRGFSTNRSLNFHIRTHTGERPHECSYCGAKFTQPYALRLHVNNVHLKNKRPNLK